MKRNEMTYTEISINSRFLEIPRAAYQRELNPSRVKKIAAEFDERIANEPKVSKRDGHYYVFDGQHTIAARKLRNKGLDLPILCKVYTGLTAGDEALLFAQQTGESAVLTAGDRMKALIYGGDPVAIGFMKATEGVGLHLDYNQRQGANRIACIGTAFNEFKRVGTDKYKEGLSILVDAWGGEPNSLRSENVQGVIRFVELYHGEYNPSRLVSRLGRIDPLTISREGRALGSSLTGYKRYLYTVYCHYNGGSTKNSLPMKF